VSPLVLPDGIVLYPTPAARLDALSPSGHLLWTQSLPAKPTYASVVTNGAGRVYTASGSSLVAIDDHGATADIAWRADPHDGQVEVSPGLAPDGTVVLGTNSSTEWGYRPDGKLAWHTRSRAETYSSPAVTHSGLAYVGDHKSRVHVYNVRTGTEVATLRLPSTDRGRRADHRRQQRHPRGHRFLAQDAKATVHTRERGRPRSRGRRWDRHGTPSTRSAPLRAASVPGTDCGRPGRS
jgi:outer membrane protein assembly factor BamB